MMFKLILGMCMALVGAVVWPQVVADPVEWTEDPALAPPAFSADALIPIEMPPYVTLKVGIDPNTIAIGADGVVRYVVVMRNASGSLSAAYEGILCTNGEVKTYGRATSTGHWTMVEQPQWRAMTDNLPSRHAYAIAQQGVCDGRTASKKEDIVRALTQRHKPG